MDIRKALAVLACLGTTLSMPLPSRADERASASCEAALHIISEIISEYPSAGWVVDDQVVDPLPRNEAKPTHTPRDIPIPPIPSGLELSATKWWDGVPPLPPQAYPAATHFEALKCPQVQTYLKAQNISFGHDARRGASGRGVVEISGLKLSGDGDDAVAIVNIYGPSQGEALQST